MTRGASGGDTCFHLRKEVEPVRLKPMYNRLLGIEMRCVQIALCLLFFMGAACGRRSDKIDVSAYDYRDTRELVRFVHRAADTLQREGMSCLENPKPDLVRLGGNYLYLYDLDGTCLYHAGMPHLEHQNLLQTTDIDDKPVHQMILEALDNPENPHGWVHYTWWKPGKFYPAPKSSCHFRVTLPDGREIFAGGGLDFPHEEREFIRISVDSAVDLIEAKGRAALGVITDPASIYQYRDVRVFAFRPDGTLVISPVLEADRFKMDLLACTDAVDHHPFERVVKQLKSAPSAWQIFMAKTRGERNLLKKILYVRKTTLEGEPLFVAAITDLPQTP